MTPRPKKLLDQVRDAIRVKHYAYSTEKTYLYWATSFVLYHDKKKRVAFLGVSGWELLRIP